MFNKIRVVNKSAYSFLLICIFAVMTYGLHSCTTVLNSSQMPRSTHADVNTAVNTFAQALIEEYSPRDAQDLAIEVYQNSLSFTQELSGGQITGMAMIEWTRESFWSSKKMAVKIRFRIDYNNTQGYAGNRKAYVAIYVLKGNDNFRRIVDSDWMRLVSGTGIYILSDYLNK